MKDDAHSKPTLRAAVEPRFALGEHVTVDPRSALCYETFTRKGAVGVIVEIGKPVRGIRRYTVRFDVPHLGGARDSRIREEHLVKVEAPAQVGEPRQYVKPRHAYEYRDQHPKDEHLWCDAGGCFIEDCVVCEAHLPTSQPRLSVDVERRIKAAYQREMDAARAGDAHAFALEEVLRYATRGDSLASLQDHRGGGMGPCYAYEWHGDVFTVTAIGPGSLEETRCHHRFSVKKLFAEAQARITGHAPQQVSLWDAAAG